MPKQITMYGKDTCPYTNAARRDYINDGYEIEYKNVVKNPEYLPEMLALTEGKRRVPVMVIDGKVIIGHGGT